MFVRVNDFASADTILDIPPHLLQGNVITDGRNYRIVDGKIGARLGSSEPYGTPSVVPYWLLPGIYGSQPYWLYAGLEKVYLIDGGTHINVTRQTTGVDVDYTATETTPWTGGGFNGIAVLNNGNDVPQMFLTLGGKCADMTNWPSTLRCKSLRPFKNFLIAANVTESGTDYPQVVRWSHPADPGSVPASWDYTDPTKDAGRKALAETPGILVDSLSAQDVHMVYKNDSVFYMQYIGAPFIFSFQPVSLTSGLAAANCVVNIPGGQVALTYDDVVLVTPRGMQSIAKKRVRKAIFSVLTSANIHAAFLAVNTALSEVWVCVPVNSEQATRAYIYNWQDDKWSMRDLPSLAAIAQGYNIATSEIWSTVVGTWDTATGVWGAADLSGAQFLGAAVPNSGKLLALENGATEDGTAVAVSIQHDAIDVFNTIQVSSERMKLIVRLRPHFTAESAGAEVYFEVGVRNTLSDNISWSAKKKFVVGTTRDLFVRKQGRYVSWRITSATPVQWDIDGMDVDVEVGGIY